MSEPRPTRNRAAAAVIGLLFSGCVLLTEPSGYRLEISGLDAPAEVAAGAPLEVRVGYLYGSCDELASVRLQRDGRLLMVEARGRPLAPCRNSGDMQYFSDTVVTITALPSGTLTVRGLQLESWRFVEVVVEITPD